MLWPNYIDHYSRWPSKKNKWFGNTDMLWWTTSPPEQKYDTNWFRCSTPQHIKISSTAFMTKPLNKYFMFTHWHWTRTAATFHSTVILNTGLSVRIITTAYYNPKITGWQFTPPKKQHNAKTYVYLLICIFTICSLTNTRPVLGNFKYKVRYQAFLQSSDVRIKGVSLEDQVIHHEAVDAFSASLQELPLILNKFPAKERRNKKRCLGINEKVSVSFLNCSRVWIPIFRSQKTHVLWDSSFLQSYACIQITHCLQQSTSLWV